MIKTKHILILLILIINIGFLIAGKQGQKLVDSLQNELPSAREDTNKVNLLAELSKQMVQFDPDKGIEYGNDALALSNKLNWDKGISKALLSLGANYSGKGKYDQAKEYYEKSLKKIKETGDLTETANIINHIAMVHYEKGEFKEAIISFSNSLKLFEQLKDSSGIAKATNNIGLIYRQQGDFDKAYEYYKKGLEIFKNMNKDNGIAKAYNNIGNVYALQNKYDKALEYYNKCYEKNKELKNKQSMASVLNNIAIIHRKNKRYDDAIKTYSESLELYEELENNKGISVLYHNIGDVYKEKGERRKAIPYFKKSVEIANKIDFKNIIKEASKNLYEAYKSIGQYKKALEMHELYLETKDSLKNEDIQRELIRQELKHEYEKEALADSLDFAKKQAIMDMKIENQNNLRNALIIGIILVIIIAMVIYRNYRQKKRSNEIINEQNKNLEEANIELDFLNKDLEEKNHQIVHANIELDALNKDLTLKNYEISSAHQRITDSITYARKIQSAVLPFESRMKENLDDYFLLYIPKDIVSGDFYWMEKIDGKTVLVVADCTGHGVPGAFMSMIGNELLNNIVVKQKILDPARVLSEMHIGVRYALKQDESQTSTHDGMDVCICIYDENLRMITFAGAKRPLYYVKDDDFIEIKGDRKSIGGRQKEEKRVFTNHEIDIDSDILIYLTSDGYQDQHSADQIKFGVIRFRDLLRSIYHKPMKDQNHILKKTLEDFSVGEMNRDDITILGVNISV